MFLGKFSRADHLDWLTKNPEKQTLPKANRVYVANLYTNGDMCELTGKPRRTEVRLKCMSNAATTDDVKMYLLEPTPCDYVLNVETPLACELIRKADETGLLAIPPFKKIVLRN